MLDARAVAKFGKIVGRPSYSWPYHCDPTRKVYRIEASGRTAEAILAHLWPYLKDTEKADQIKAACKTVGVSLKYRGIRPYAYKGSPGDKNGRAKITNYEAGQIKRAYAKGGVTQRQLAERYGISQVRVSQILKGSLV